jgi:hypothetical protein
VLMARGGPRPPATRLDRAVNARAELNGDHGFHLEFGPGYPARPANPTHLDTDRRGPFVSDFGSKPPERRNKFYVPRTPAGGSKARPTSDIGETEDVSALTDR